MHMRMAMPSSHAHLPSEVTVDAGAPVFVSPDAPDAPETLAKAAEMRQNALFVGVYLLTFAYPVVSVKVVELFGCHNVEGTFYLRADYSLECYTAEWNAMAAYAGVWIVFYVILFPLFVTRDLLLQWRRHSPAQLPEWLERLFQRIASERQLRARPMLGFLADDYKPDQPMALWEALEMARKLLLSVIGAFWSTQSTMCVATALLISLCFQLLQSHYSPFKVNSLNTAKF